MKENILKVKSYQFAIRVVRLYQFLCKEKKEFVISKQILRSGTAIGALIREAEFAQSRADFTNKMHVALKEANETIYWLEILSDARYIDEKMFQSLHGDCEELMRILISTVKTSKNNL